MKFKKVIIVTAIIFILSSLTSKCFAKYVIEYNKKVVEIIINN